MLADRRSGLTVTILATRVLPVLLPHLVITTHLICTVLCWCEVSPQHQLDTYLLLHTTVQEMLDTVDRHQRNKLKTDEFPELPAAPSFR